MADDVVIRAKGLGKRYVIGHQAAERVPTLRDSLTRTASNFARTTRDLLRGRALITGDAVEEFWALKDIDFEIKRGEVVGIIGRNGAGKSTLLKVLSRITEPSEGRVEIRGRVGSLLEVGTGFHPELTGRENIFLNGAILGMAHAEIRRKFDEIVEFSGVSRFLDTPVKRYSSGMYVRLAFAVSAHLEPEILIVDEVLAVGDSEFQNKCLGKMQDVAGEGRTVLFVSHNMAAVRQLCPSAILLKDGRLQAEGGVEEIIDLYARASYSRGQTRRNPDEPFFLRIESVSASIDEPFRFDVNISLYCSHDIGAELRCVIRSSNGVCVGISSLGGFGSKPLIFSTGDSSVSVSIEVGNLASDIYQIDFELMSSEVGKILASASADPIEFSPSPLPGDLVYLRGEWGFGAMRFPAKLISQI